MKLNLKKQPTATVKTLLLKKTFSRSALVVALSASLIAVIGVPSAYAGSTPNGKPFVEINGQIMEVEGAISSIEDQIDILVGRVDSIEGKVEANEAAIVVLQDQNDSLSALVDQNLSDIAAIQVEITALQQANTDLQGMIEDSSGDIDALRLEIDANEALIATLQSAILLIDSDVISIETSLQEQIDNNFTLIGALQDQIDGINEAIAYKQDLVNGICPDTQAIGRINPDGSVVCNSLSTSNALEIYRVWQWFTVPRWGTASKRLYCDDGDLPTSVGYRYAHSDIEVRYAYISSAGAGLPLGGYVVAENMSYINNHDVMELIVCVRGADRISDNP